MEIYTPSFRRLESGTRIRRKRITEINNNIFTINDQLNNQNNSASINQTKITINDEDDFRCEFFNQTISNNNDPLDSRYFTFLHCWIQWQQRCEYILSDYKRRLSRTPHKNFILNKTYQQSIHLPIHEFKIERQKIESIIKSSLSAAEQTKSNGLNDDLDTIKIATSNVTKSIEHRICALYECVFANLLVANGYQKEASTVNASSAKLEETFELLNPNSSSQYVYIIIPKSKSQLTLPILGSLQPLLHCRVPPPNDQLSMFAALADLLDLPLPQSVNETPSSPKMKFNYNCNNKGVLQPPSHYIRCLSDRRKIRLPNGEIVEEDEELRLSPLNVQSKSIAVGQLFHSHTVNHGLWGNSSADHLGQKLTKRRALERSTTVPIDKSSQSTISSKIYISTKGIRAEPSLKRFKTENIDQSNAVHTNIPTSRAAFIIGDHNANMFSNLNSNSIDVAQQKIDAELKSIMLRQRIEKLNNEQLLDVKHHQMKVDRSPSIATTQSSEYFDQIVSDRVSSFERQSPIQCSENQMNTSSPNSEKNDELSPISSNEIVLQTNYKNSQMNAVSANHIVEIVNLNNVQLNQIIANQTSAYYQSEKVDVFQATLTKHVQFAN